MLKALESVLDGGRGRGTGEANTAVVPQAPPGTTANQPRRAGRAEGHRIELERSPSPGRRKTSVPKAHIMEAALVNGVVRRALHLLKRFIHSLKCQLGRLKPQLCKIMNA